MERLILTAWVEQVDVDPDTILDENPDAILDENLDPILDEKPDENRDAKPDENLEENSNTPSPLPDANPDVDADVRFVARVDGIDLWGAGDSPDVAREQLIQAMLDWISLRDCTDSMAGVLAEAGFPEIDDETELQLEFADSFADLSADSPQNPGLYDPN